MLSFLGGVQANEAKVTRTIDSTKYVNRLQKCGRILDVRRSEQNTKLPPHIFQQQLNGDLFLPFCWINKFNFAPLDDTCFLRGWKFLPIYRKVVQQFSIEKGKSLLHCGLFTVFHQVLFPPIFSYLRYFFLRFFFF